jgi:hypothetical protein
MVFYKRNINNKLFALRFISLVLAISCYWSFDKGKDNPGYVLAVALIVLSLITIEGLVVYAESFQVKKFYFFGLIPINWTFTKEEKAVLVAYGSGFGEEGDLLELGQSETGVGCLYFLLSAFMKQGNITHIKYTIKPAGSRSNLFKRVDVMLSHEEYQLIIPMVQ